MAVRKNAENKQSENVAVGDNGDAAVIGVLIRKKLDETIAARARAAKMTVTVGHALSVPFEKTLIVEPGTQVPWDLLPAASAFLTHWDAAAPLWRYGVLASDVGDETDRAATLAIVRDLRCLLHSTELLFVRQNDAGRALVETWQNEMRAGGDERLAFLRAFYMVKPRLCTLPVTWLADVRTQSQQALQRGAQPARVGKLVRVELEPGRYVKCYPGDEEKVLANHRAMKAGRAK